MVHEPSLYKAYMQKEVCVRRVGKLCILILRALYTYRGFSFIYRQCDRGQIGIKVGTKHFACQKLRKRKSLLLGLEVWSLSCKFIYQI